MPQEVAENNAPQDALQLETSCVVEDLMTQEKTLKQTEEGLRMEYPATPFVEDELM
jgi:hypothetical protein